MRRFVLLMISVLLISNTAYAAKEPESALAISAESGVIMEMSSGKVLYEKNGNVELPPASVTKVMTLLLIFDALEEGRISLEEEVVTSEYAASMGGSQVFLEVGEKQTVDTMIKCISVASANDACVAMAERISGTEEAFVAEMNERAKHLGMEHTHFVNCNGLDADGHLTSAYDIALMSRELMTKYPKIMEYTRIWMDEITHTTRKGSEQFGLSNTNKLIRQYEYATGLKTGSTSKAKFCLSATASKDDIDLIAVVMAEPDAKTRVKDAIAMLNYGFSRCSVYRDENVMEKTFEIPVTRGQDQSVSAKVQNSFCYTDTEGLEFTKIEKNTIFYPIEAPVKKGDKVGNIEYKYGDRILGQIPVFAVDDVERMTYKSAILYVFDQVLL